MTKYLHANGSTCTRANGSCLVLFRFLDKTADLQPISLYHRLEVLGDGRRLFLAVRLIVEVGEENNQRDGVEDECPLVGDGNATVQEGRRRDMPQDRKKLDLKVWFISNYAVQLRIMVTSQISPSHN